MAGWFRGGERAGGQRKAITPALGSLVRGGRPHNVQFSYKPLHGKNNRLTRGGIQTGRFAAREQSRHRLEPE